MPQIDVDLNPFDVDLSPATLKVSEAARIARTGEKAIRLGIAAGAIPHLKFGRTIRIPKSSFLKWLETCGAR
jgi:excisionase family DNA binding protein